MTDLGERLNAEAEKYWEKEADPPRFLIWVSPFGTHEVIPFSNDEIDLAIERLYQLKAKLEKTK